MEVSKHCTFCHPVCVRNPKGMLFSSCIYLQCTKFFQVYKKLGQNHLAQMNFSWAIDLDPKGANNQIKEAINKRYLPDDEDTTMGLDAADTTLEQSLGMSDEDHMGVESD